MLQRVETYSLNNHLEIIKTRESRMVEIEKIEIARKVRGVRKNYQKNTGSNSGSGVSNKVKGRFIDLYC